MDTTHFEQQLIQSVEGLGRGVLERYKECLQVYREQIIPFEVKRMKQNSTVSFKNTSLERDKNDLLSRIEELSSEKQRLEYVMEKQQHKIHQLQRKTEQQESINQDHLLIIEGLKNTCNEMEASLNEKIEIIKQIQDDKKKVLVSLQEKSNDYNILLANFMKDKNFIAEKLNSINDMEQSILEKERNIKQQQFYLKKEWEKFQQEKNSTATSKSIIPNRQIGKKTSISVEEEEKQIKGSLSKHEILTSPLKKIYKHHQHEIYDLSLNYNGNLLATCGGDRQIKIFDVLNLKSGVNISTHSAESVYISVAMDYGGERVLAGSTDKSILVFNTVTGKQLNSFVGHGEKINAVTWSSSKEKCVSGSDDRQIKIWDIEKGSNLHSISCGRAVKVVTCNTVQPIVYSGHSDGSVRVYSLNQGSHPISQVRGVIDYPITSISMISNRNQVLVSSQEGTTIHLLDFKMNKSISKYQHKDFFNTSMKADISPSEGLIVGGNCDGYLYYWNREKRNMEKRVSGHDCPITALKYHFMSGVLTSCDREGNIIIWQ